MATTPASGDCRARTSRFAGDLRNGQQALATVAPARVVVSDATAWQFVIPGLAKRFRVLVYDRRGHSRSERPEGQGSMGEDGDDLAALLETLELAPAHVVTSSSRGNIALKLGSDDRTSSARCGATSRP